MILEFFVIKSKLKQYFSNLNIKDNEGVLDLGCGENPYYHGYLGDNLVCLDVKSSDKINVIGSADALPFKKNSFEKIVSVNSFYYFKNPFDVSENLSKILKKNGKLVIIIPFFYPIHDIPHDKYRFTQHGIKTLLEENFKLEKVETLGGIFTLPSVFFHSIIKSIINIFPKSLKFIGYLLSLVFYPFYIVSQLFSLLDFLIANKRIPTYYFIVAKKK